MTHYKPGNTREIPKDIIGIYPFISGALPQKKISQKRGNSYGANKPKGLNIRHIYH